MSESAVSAVGYDELAALKFVALEGGRSGPVKISCSGLAGHLDASSQTASRRLQRLESAGHLDRDVVADGQWVSLTESGEAALHREYDHYRRIFEGDGPSTVELEGTVTSGMGEGRHYISLSGYVEQFRERLGYEPFPGTLNVDLSEESVRRRGELTGIEAVPIDAWEDDDRTYGAASCYGVTVVAGDERYEEVHAIVPDRTHHDDDQLELIAPERLRDALGLDDGSEIEIRVAAAERADDTATNSVETEVA